MSENQPDHRPQLEKPLTRRNAPFYALVLGAFALLTIARNAQPGMFLDGVTYASIARNLAEGRGSFWSLSYTSTLYPSFHEQPPLGFALQAAAFALFGDHLVVERAYSVVAGLLIVLVMMLTWRRTVSERGDDWLPIIFWLIPPTVTWSIVNNMLDVTQALFAALAVFAFIQSLNRSAWWRWAIAAGLSIIAAVLTKGPTGFFPLAAPAIGALLMRDRFARSVRSGLVIYGTVAAVLALLLIPGTSRSAIAIYWNQQVAASISGARGGAGRLSAIEYYLFVPVIGRMFALFILAWVSGRLIARQDRAPDRRAAPWTWFFLLLALAGSLPIALSARMAGHYFLPSITCYALGFASLSLPFIQPALDRWRTRPAVRKSVGVAGGVFFAGALIIPLLGRSLEPRDVAWMREYRMLSSSIPRGVTLGTCEAVRSDWGLHAYMQRLFEVSLDPETGRDRHPYFLQLTDRPCEVPPGCDAIAVTPRLALHKCRVD